MADIQIKIDNSEKIKKELSASIDRALEAIGMQVENYASGLCPVDTGLLRNSITHALSGERVDLAYSGDTGGKNGKAVPHGAYGGSAPDDPENKKAVYIGTNVEYGIYVHEGYQKANGTSVPARRFLKNAIMNHKDEYRRLAKDALEGRL